MGLENGMFFALGFLAATLIAVAVGPAFWRRAVRLTRRRVEAATPVTLSEFRADKDRLRAEFAMKLRRHELYAEGLREKLVGAATVLDRANTELAAVRGERDAQLSAIETLSAREAELSGRLRDLDRDHAGLAAQLRQAEEMFARLGAPLMPDSVGAISAEQLTGNYRADVEDLLAALARERERGTYLEDQVRMLLERLEKRRKSGLKDEAVAVLRDALAIESDSESGARIALRKAENRVVNAEARLGALLSEAEAASETISAGPPRALAEDLSLAEHEGALRAKVAAIEELVLAGQGGEDFDVAGLRARLEEIAADAAGLVYAEDGHEEEVEPASLFDRVVRFAPEGIEDGAPPANAAAPEPDRVQAPRAVERR